ncbi:hypothetical protein WISP_113622 [Willisornis vidua]|uniref:Uncharacterized protein n=1 Tax=Willisornis vidua TaxID=1566151 RepID=A0ABQ9D0U9_9PASS|nr:hypothetical protein WISP_113622 [Willisornis vidua]
MQQPMLDMVQGECVDLPPYTGYGFHIRYIKTTTTGEPKFIFELSCAEYGVGIAWPNLGTGEAVVRIKIKIDIEGSGQQGNSEPKAGFEHQTAFKHKGKLQGDKQEAEGIHILHNVKIRS